MSNILDPIYLLIMFFVFTLACVIAYFVFSSFSTSSGLIPANIAQGGENFYTALNAFGIFIVVAIILGTIGSAFLIRTNPIFFAVSIILLFVQLMIFPMLITVFNPLFQGFASGANKMDLLIWLVQISPAISLVGGILAGVVALRGE